MTTSIPLRMIFSASVTGTCGSIHFPSHQYCGIRKQGSCGERESYYTITLSSGQGENFRRKFPRANYSASPKCVPKIVPEASRKRAKSRRQKRRKTSETALPKTSEPPRAAKLEVRKRKRPYRFSVHGRSAVYLLSRKSVRAPFHSRRQPKPL